jgi:hypothetical protein
LRGPSTSRGAVADEERPHTTLGHASACLSPAYLTIPELERIGAHPADHPKGNDWSGRFPLAVEAEPPSLDGPWSALERARGILWGYQRNATLDFSRPGKPTDKAVIESFNGKFRGESLIAHWFMSLDERAENARLGVETTTRKRLQRDRPKSSDRARRLISGARSALSETAWKKSSRPVHGVSVVRKRDQ